MCILATSMRQPSDHSAARLLLLLADFGQTVSQAMKAAVGEPDLVGNLPILILCSIDLEGPQRPRSLQRLTGLSSGAMSKLLDRMERSGVVRRDRRSADADRRAVFVTLTKRGERLLGALRGELAARIPQTEALVQEIVVVLNDLER
jgi:DNA-binding MarR family transcriptional regulator